MTLRFLDWASPKAYEMIQAEVIQWLEGSLGSTVPSGEAALLDWLTDYCNGLLVRDFPRLVQLLYRVDVSEARLKTTLVEAGGQDAGRIMAILLLERVGEIVRARKQYKMPERDIPEEDKW